MFEPQVVSVPWEEGDNLPVNHGDLKGNEEVMFVFQFGKYEIKDSDSQFLEQLFESGQYDSYVDGDVYRPMYVSVVPCSVARKILARSGNRIIACFASSEQEAFKFARANSGMAFKMMMAWLPHVMQQIREAAAA